MSKQSECSKDSQEKGGKNFPSKPFKSALPALAEEVFNKRAVQRGDAINKSGVDTSEQSNRSTRHTRDQISKAHKQAAPKEA